MNRINNYLIIRGSDGSPSSLMRRDIRVGDMVRRKDRVAPGGWRVVGDENQLSAFYRSLGIDIWFDGRWVA